MSDYDFWKRERFYARKFGMIFDHSLTHSLTHSQLTLLPWLEIIMVGIARIGVFIYPRHMAVPPLAAFL